MNDIPQCPATQYRVTLGLHQPTVLEIEQEHLTLAGFFDISFAASRLFEAETFNISTGLIN